MKDLKVGTPVLCKDLEYDFCVEGEFLKYDEDLEYGKYVCLYWTQDGKVVECFDEIELL